MKAETFSIMEHGTHLLLKADRAVAYGVETWQPVLFDHVQPRAGYSIPWIVAYWQGEIPGDEKVGHFKPQDFKGFYHERTTKTK